MKVPTTGMKPLSLLSAGCGVKGWIGGERCVAGSNRDYVEFFSDGFLVGSDTKASYTLMLNKQNAGTQVFMARVFNTSGLHGMSAPRQVTF